MEIRTDLEIGQRTQLVMTPHMQQALRVLQAPAEELATVLSEALSTNPFLEEDSPAGQERRYVAMDGLLLLGFGPRAPEAVRSLATALRGG